MREIRRAARGFRLRVEAYRLAGLKRVRLRAQFFELRLELAQTLFDAGGGTGLCCFVLHTFRANILSVEECYRERRQCHRQGSQ